MVKGFKIVVFLFVVFIVRTTSTNAQVSILSASLNSINVTPSTLCQVNLFSQEETKVSLEAFINNTANDEVIHIKTTPFTIKKGFNAGLTLPIQIESFSFSLSPQGTYVKVNKALPSGNFKYCVHLIGDGNDYNDELCQDVSSQINSYLTLISPFDKDTIYTPNPLLSWNHSEPFNILSVGEFFRMFVVEITPGQNAESSIEVNTPVFFKDNLNSHIVLYPYDAKELKPGKRYGWQVQKISNGVIIDKTEAWEFVLDKKNPIPENKYAVLQKTINGSFYTAVNKKIFFKFNEDYTGSSLKSFIYDEKHKVITPVLKNENKNIGSNSNTSVDTKMNGYNRFEIDLNKLGLDKGYYTLEVLNEKNEKFIMKFYVE